MSRTSQRVTLMHHKFTGGCGGPAMYFHLPKPGGAWNYTNFTDLQGRIIDQVLIVKDIEPPHRDIEAVPCGTCGQSAFYVREIKSVVDRYLAELTAQNAEIFERKVIRRPDGYVEERLPKGKVVIHEPGSYTVHPSGQIILAGEG
jgi:hypothetical protein